jgi:glycolate oxidase iron-sulfur subunit
VSIPKTEESHFAARFAEYARTLDCIHCGLCIPHCPTHSVTGREADSPRGRIHLMRGYAEGRFELSAGAELHLAQCIVCRACESVCPSGIRMGEMMESFREEMGRLDARKTVSAAERFFFRKLLPYRSRLALLSDVLELYQKMRLARIVQALLERVSPALARAHALQPAIPSRAVRRLETERSRPQGYAALGERRARVALFLGCIAAEWFAPVHRATIRVLQRNGCDVVIPDDQTCCGALHRHAGLLADARELEARNARAFARDFDAVIVNSAGCGASLKEPLDRHDRSGLPFRDVCEFLHELGLRAPDRAVKRKVAYDEPCHLVHGQRIGREVVERLLAKIPELERVPLTGSERCCGAGGVYNLRHPEMAEPVLEEKVRAIRKSGADTVATGNPGCAMQIAKGLRGRSIEVVHPIELLDRAYS